MISDHYVVIQDWKLYFRPEETFLSTLLVWVRLPVFLLNILIARFSG
ncbi:hypothetical protein LINPERHAP2_LOCUS5656 [Linum perenne]